VNTLACAPSGETKNEQQPRNSLCCGYTHFLYVIYITRWVDVQTSDARAYEWGKLDRPAKIKLAAGERQRDRVLDEKEITKYLAACPQPWKDCAALIFDEGFRPGEVQGSRAAE
jgi:integrase